MHYLLYKSQTIKPGLAILQCSDSCRSRCLRVYRSSKLTIHSHDWPCTWHKPSIRNSTSPGLWLRISGAMPQVESSERF